MVRSHGEERSGRKDARRCLASLQTPICKQTKYMHKYVHGWQLAACKWHGEVVVVVVVAVVVGWMDGRMDGWMDACGWVVRGRRPIISQPIWGLALNEASSREANGRANYYYHNYYDNYYYYHCYDYYNHFFYYFYYYYNYYHNHHHHHHHPHHHHRRHHHHHHHHHHRHPSYIFT
jgi:hypothetical protein